MRPRTIAPLALAAAWALMPAPARAVTARWAFEDAYDNVAGGDWYRDSNNETATLAWGESYVMWSLAAMYRATGDPLFLERLAHHADGVLAQRDDARGVTDYRGVSGACWQDRHYQAGNEPYCYAVHSGMIGYPIALFARLVRDAGLEAEALPDGTGRTFGDAAAAYVAALEETVAYHDDEWRDAGYYVFRPDAPLETAGRDQPLNQSNALGMLLLVLADLTGEPAYLEKATALATRFRAQITTSGGAYYWNYWGGTYAAPGEDVSHAAINVDFAIEAAALGVVFTDADLAAFATTFLASVYITDRSVSNNVGGGGANDPSYRPQIGRWLRLARVRTGVYTAVRDIYDVDYPPASIASGSLLLGWAYLAELEPPLCAPFFYSVDWLDPDPATTGDLRQATAYGANILTTPPDLARGCMVPIGAIVPRLVDVQQWDGEAYHTVATLSPSAGAEVSRHIPYDPRWPFIYWEGGVLYQFADDFVAGQGIRVREHPGLAAPRITSTPPTAGDPGGPVAYAPVGTGDPPFWWSLGQFPTGARVDAATGALDFVPPGPGTYAFVLRLENDVGLDEQAFEVVVAGPADGDGDGDADGDGGPDADADGDADGDGGPDADAGADADADGDGGLLEGGCGCGAAAARSSVGVLARLWP